MIKRENLHKAISLEASLSNYEHGIALLQTRLTQDHGGLVSIQVTYSDRSPQTYTVKTTDLIECLERTANDTLSKLTGMGVSFPE